MLVCLLFGLFVVCGCCWIFGFRVGFGVCHSDLVVGGVVWVVFGVFVSLVGFIIWCCVVADGFAIWGFGGRFVVLGIWLHCKLGLFILLSVLDLIPLFLITMVCVFLVVLDFVCVGWVGG